MKTAALAFVLALGLAAPAAYARTVAIAPDSTGAREYRGIAHLMNGDRGAAVRDYQALVRLGSPIAGYLKARIDASAR